MVPQPGEHQEPLNHELTVSHGSPPVQQIDSVLLKENMNNMKRLLLGKGVASENLTDVTLCLLVMINASCPLSRARRNQTQLRFA